MHSFVVDVVVVVLHCLNMFKKKHTRVGNFLVRLKLIFDVRILLYRPFYFIVNKLLRMFESLQK